MTALRSITDKERTGTVHVTQDGVSKPLQAEIPNPPAYLDAAPRARELYFEVCQFLQAYKSFSEVDHIAVAALSWWAYIYETAVKNVQEGGAVQTFESGATNVTGWFTAMEKADKKVMTYMNALGLNPKSRNAIRSFMDRKPSRGSKDDPFSPL